MHMLSIFHALRSQGHIHASFDAAVPDPVKPAHLGIPGIWEKLASLYDLDALDERETTWRVGGYGYDAEGDVLGGTPEEDERPAGRRAGRGAGRRRSSAPTKAPAASKRKSNAHTAMEKEAAQLWPPGTQEFELDTDHPSYLSRPQTNEDFNPADETTLGELMFARRLKDPDNPDDHSSESPPPIEMRDPLSSQQSLTRATTATATTASSPPAEGTRAGRKRAATTTRRSNVGASSTPGRRSSTKGTPSDVSGPLPIREAGGRRGSRVSTTTVTASDVEGGTEVGDEDSAAGARRSGRGTKGSKRKR